MFAVIVDIGSYSGAETAEEGISEPAAGSVARGGGTPKEHFRQDGISSSHICL